jgi:hypothetical protein
MAEVSHGPGEKGGEAGFSHTYTILNPEKPECIAEVNKVV